jgi:hypothetical protein
MQISCRDDETRRAWRSFAEIAEGSSQSAVAFRSIQKVSTAHDLRIAKAVGNRCEFALN